jgi:flagellar FliL protein
MAEEEKAEEKKSGNPMMLVLVILIVILLAAVGGIGYMLYAKGFFSDKPADGAKVEQKKESSDEAKQFFKAEIKDLVLNITNAKGREKLMKLSFSIKSTEPTIDAIVGANKDEIIDAVIQQISARNSEELLTVGGQDLLKEELLSEINTIVNEATKNNKEIKRNNVKKLYFTTFVIK